MGIVRSQSFKNTLYTYIGFIVGAINTLFFYTNFLSETYYGLVGYLLSTATILMPLMAFGVHNTLVKFYSSYTDVVQQQRFTFMMFLLPLAIILPVGALGIIGYEWIVELLSANNTIIAPYVWTIYVVAVVLAYFEVFYAWTRVQLRSVFGNFMKEVFHRVGTMLLLITVYLEWLDVDGFIIAIVCMYVIRTLLMLLSAVLVKKPLLEFKLPSNAWPVFKYAALIIVAGSIAMLLLDVDKFMLAQYMPIENVAYYNVAVFIAMVIVVPSRAMYQITAPVTAQLLNKKQKDELADLYRRSSLTLYLISGVIFLLIVLNIKQMYLLLPSDYSQGLIVVFLISLAKLSDALIGNNNAILFNSSYYRMVLFFGLLLTVLTIALNMILIPIWGINGSALATLMAFWIYNGLKLFFIHRKYGIHPFTHSTLYATVLFIIVFVLFYFWDFSFHPVVNIVLKTILITLISVGTILKLRLSEDIQLMALHLFKRFK